MCMVLIQGLTTELHPSHRSSLTRMAQLLAIETPWFSRCHLRVLGANLL